MCKKKRKESGEREREREREMHTVFGGGRRCFFLGLTWTNEVAS